MGGGGGRCVGPSGADKINLVVATDLREPGPCYASTVANGTHKFFNFAKFHFMKFSVALESHSKFQHKLHNFCIRSEICSDRDCPLLGGSGVTGCLTIDPLEI